MEIIIVALCVLVLLGWGFFMISKLAENFKNSDRDAVRPQKMVAVRFNIDNSKYGRHYQAETENVPVVETDKVPLPPQTKFLVENGKSKIIGVVECHGKNAGLVLACTIGQKCSNGSLILNTLNGPVRKKKRYVSF